MVWTRRFISLRWILFAALLMLVGCAAGTKGVPEPPHLMKRADRAALAGWEAYASGDYTDALASFTEALRIDRSLDDRSAEIMDLVNIGRVLIVLGDYDGAVAGLNEAVSVATAADDDVGLVSALATLAKAAYITGDRSGALKHLERSLLIGGVKGAETGAILNLQGLIYMDAGSIPEAKKIFHSALKLNKRRGDALETANSHRGLAKLSLTRDDPASALYHYMAAYKLDRALGDPARIAFDLDSLAGVHLKEGRLKEAAFIFERSYLVNLNSGRLGPARSDIDSLLRIYRKLGDERRVLYWDGLGHKD
jgi:tetratricopeptide (TPR) repeat protein